MSKAIKEAWKEGRKEREAEIIEILDKELKLEKTMTNDKVKQWLNTTLKRIKIQIKRSSNKTYTN